MTTQMQQHCMIKFPKGFKEDFFVSAAQDNFKVEKIIVDIQMGEIEETIKKQIATLRKINLFALYVGKDYFYRLRLNDTVNIDEIIKDCSGEWRKVDAEVLKRYILGDIFNISDDIYADRITYTDSISAGMKEIREGEHRCLICLNPVISE